MNHAQSRIAMAPDGAGSSFTEMSNNTFHFRQKDKRAIFPLHSKHHVSLSSNTTIRFGKTREAKVLGPVLSNRFSVSAGVRVSAETHNPDIEVNNPEVKVSASGHPDTC